MTTNASRSRRNSLEEDLFSRQFFRVTAVLSFAAIVALAAGHFLLFFVLKDPPYPLQVHLNLDNEGNISTWINSLMLLAASIAAFLVSWTLNKNRQLAETGDRAKRERIGWLFTGLAFLYLATDDAAQIHDVLAGVLVNRLRELAPAASENTLWYAWIPVFIVLGILTILLLTPMIRRTLMKDRSVMRLVVAGVFCFMANPIVEILENMRVDLIPESLKLQGVKVLVDINPRAWHELQGLIILEEGLEMLGATFFLLGFLLIGRRLVGLVGVGPQQHQ